MGGDVNYQKLLGEWMKKCKLTDHSLSKDREKEQRQRSSPKPILMNGHCASIKLQKYLNTTLNLPAEKPTYRDSVESRRTNILKNKRVHTPLYHSFKEAQSSSLKKLSKSRDKLGSTMKLKQTKKKVHKPKSNISQKEEYLVREIEEDKDKQVEKQKEKEKVVGEIQRLILSFQEGDQSDDFQEYIKEIGMLNEKINQQLETMEESKLKTIISKYKNITIDISTKCLSRLYDRAETADVSFNNTFERIEYATKEKYQKKIQKLMHVISEKQKKEKEVNKLLYFLRKNGVDIDDYWNKAVLEERRCKTQLEKRFVNDI